MRKLAMLVVALTQAACAGLMPGERTVKVNLTGAEEVPPVSVPGTGSGSFTVGEDGAVKGSVTTSNVQGTMAHIHIAPRGVEGPVIIPLQKSGDTYTAPPGAKLTPAQMEAFRAGNLYVNVHTARNKAGEVRAQLQP